jgi:hypothetical protein
LGAAAHLNRPLALWTGILAGPAAWGAYLTISYALVEWTCLTQNETPLRAIALSALLVALGGGAVSWVALQHTSGEAPTDGGRPRHRARFMAVLGLTMSVLFALTIVAGTIPQWVLDACQ